jgi:hypothetical protein
MDMLHLHDLDVKRMALSDLREKYSIWFAVEDRAAVVKMWREEGIMCLQNCEGNY